MTVAALEVGPNGIPDGLVERLGALVGQLSSSATRPTRDEVEVIVASPACHLLLAREGAGTAGESVLGMLTLAVFAIPTGIRAVIEDVVVDEAARGRGIARSLVAAALDLAAAQGARTVDLTSRPTREAANRLYRGMGFATRETNVYRFTHEGPVAVVEEDASRG